MINEEENQEALIEGSKVDELIKMFIKKLISQGEKYDLDCTNSHYYVIGMKTYTMQFRSKQADNLLYAGFVWDFRNWSCDSDSLKMWWETTKYTGRSIEDHYYNLKDGTGIIQNFILENGFPLE
jgi:hypothetical protein